MDQAAQDLPPEILEHIVNYMTDKSKRYMRLASTTWFQLINYLNFKIYMADATTLPLIVNRLRKYDGPIGLTFKKSKFIDHLAEVSRLTNLTYLDLPTLDSSIWRNITVLTNLQNCPFSHAAPPQVLASLVNLREISLTSNKSAPLVGAMKKMSFLQRIQVAPDYKQPLDLFSLLPCPSLLTHLDVHASLDHSNTTKFYNLKSLKYENWHRSDISVSLEKFTALENLTIEQQSFHSFNNLPTQLTSLTLWIKQLNMDGLTRLQHIRAISLLNVDAYDEQLASIGQLTALSSLNLWPTLPEGPERAFTGEFLEHFQTNQLTQLILELTRGFDPYHLTRLTSLETLHLNEADTNDYIWDYSFISHLTRLTAVYLRAHNASPSLAAAHELKHLEVWPALDDGRVKFPEISLSRLTKLERVCIGDYSRVTCESLSALKHLTHLFATQLDLDVDYGFIKELPLQQIVCTTDEPLSDSFYNAMVQLPDLQLLEAWHFTAKRVIGLSSLQHLTYLRLNMCDAGVDGKHLTHLTSVQVLYVVANSEIPLNQNEIKRRMPNLYNTFISVKEICEPQIDDYEF